MLALFGNLSFVEVVLFSIVAILVFGRRLPEVIGDGARKLGALRRSLEDLRRETGIDADLREVRQSLQGGLDPGVRPRDLERTASRRLLQESGLDEVERAVRDAEREARGGPPGAAPGAGAPARPGGAAPAEPPPDAGA